MRRTLLQRVEQGECDVADTRRVDTRNARLSATTNRKIENSYDDVNLLRRSFAVGEKKVVTRGGPTVRTATTSGTEGADKRSREKLLTRKVSY